MGADYEAFSVIGCRVAGSKLYRTTTSKTCSHVFDTSFAFCPKCGKPATETEEEAIFDECAGDYTRKINGLDIVAPCSEDIPEWVVIGPIAARNDDFDAFVQTLLPANLDAIKEQTRAGLEPLGLWNESEFGLWTLLDCSY